MALQERVSYRVTGQPQRRLKIEWPWTLSKRHMDPGPTRGAWWTPVLRDGTRPVFLLADAAGCALAAVATQTGWWSAAAFSTLLLVLFASVRLYRSRLALSVLDDLPRITQTWLVALALLLIGSTLLRGGFTGLDYAALCLAGVVLMRSAAYGLVRLLRRRRVVAHATVVVGTDTTGQAILGRLDRNPQTGLLPLGFLDDLAEPATGLPAPLLGGIGEVNRVLQENEVRALVIAHGHLPESQLITMIRACHRHHCELFVLPRLYEVTQVGADMDFVGEMPLVRLRRAAYRSWAWRAKRLLDVVVSATALVLLAPVMAVLALAVRLEGGPGVIFRQERVGVDGRRFDVLKFRSLRPVDETESQTQWNISHDDRLGPVGRLIRKTSLDELPQLWNVLRGDMSLVGPRPERPHFVAEFDRLYVGYQARHRVPCGLTGWAQVHGLRGDTSIADRAAYDNFYIENWSLWLDLKILLLTVVAVFTDPGS
ncbi:exopolysaccharide biosynthesis polyprenyl glycosylphosphotransferase [Auraticoccus sp. F435]|uniref:Exopolysaccharide biosynthesis polyprenyl glycosylphosphotransferase n=1 Tax=Auraticoccus cholistanensis TaxID=2656650 RepID=A0A6A9V1J7_9ACTN|nr:sugar transferase [Auraticoccus cholistanensis]MVA77270.1 exopolysaccharide biosynthesis polyprenyl glycosylphosphotransferase [Auraticoccus cholistanensis]